MDLDDIITGDKFLSLNSNDIAYIKTDTLILQEHIEWRGAIHSWRPAPVWISGHSDYPITEGVFRFYEKYCKIWFASNKDIEHPKIISIPIGITNFTQESPDHPIFGNIDIMKEVALRPRTIQNLVYMNFLVRTYPPEREVCYSTFYGKPWVTLGHSEKTLDARKQFLIDIRNHLFVLCPRGNGVDTHRLWETLYMGSIPIVKRDIAVRDFTDLPILFVDDWNEITEDYLLEKYEEMKGRTWNMKKLTFTYWKERILKALTEAAEDYHHVKIHV
jgi:hypothetical protein